MPMMGGTSASPDNRAIREIAKYAKQQGKQTTWIIVLTIVMSILASIQILILLRSI